MMYYLARFAVRLLMLALFRIRVVGSANVPESGAVIICSNHFSNWDPVFIGCFLPRAVSFMAKDELFHFAPFGALLRSLHTFPVRRGAGDRGAIRAALEVLAGGNVLVMFPEGHRRQNGRLETLERGAGLLATRSNALVVPVAVCGSYRPFGLVQLTFGAPFTVFGERIGGKDAHKGSAVLATEEIAARMRGVLEDCRHDAANR